MNGNLTLDCLKIGESSTVKELSVSGSMRRRLLDIGLMENTLIECIGRSPSGDPSAYMIRGAVIALRSEDCSYIIIKSNKEE